MAEVQPIQITINELQNPDIQLRLNSIRRISSIAKALGPERTRNELIPLLAELDDDEDEVLQAIAHELGSLGDLVGGSSHCTVLLNPLERLAQVEEVVVRDRAVQSMSIIIEKCSKESFESHVIPLVSRLSHAQWFTGKSSACSLTPVVYKRASNPQRDDMITQYIRLSHDTAPMVRRAAVASLGPLASVAGREVTEKALLNAFHAFCRDDQDSVRLLALEAAPVLGSLFDAETNAKNVLQGIKVCALDKSWRVRFMVAEQICPIARCFSQSVINDEFVPIFVKLLRDAEAEVRTAMAKTVSEFVKVVQPLEITINQILPPIKELSSDGSEHVRCELASVVTGLAPTFGKENTLNHLLNMFISLLKDEVPQVRLNVIGKLESINKVIGIELLSQSLLPAIVELAEDRQWRVRLAIIEYVPILAQELGQSFFNEKLLGLCMTWLSDSVYSIRDAAINNLKKLTVVFGVPWAQQHVLPKIISLFSHPNYLYRMTTLGAVGVMAEVVGEDVTTSSLLPLVLRMANDPVPNIRFNVAKTLQLMGVSLSRNTIQSQVKPVLQALSNNDTDDDVKFFAGQALAALDNKK